MALRLKRLDKLRNITLRNILAATRWSCTTLFRKGFDLVATHLREVSSGNHVVSIQHAKPTSYVTGLSAKKVAEKLGITQDFGQGMQAIIVFVEPNGDKMPTVMEFTTITVKGTMKPIRIETDDQPRSV